MRLDRRWFLQGSLFTGVGLALGCADDSDPANTGAGGRQAEGGGSGGAGGAGGAGGGGGGGGPVNMCDDPFADGQLVGPAPITDHVTSGVPFHTPLGVGWDGRLYTDLSQLSSHDLGDNDLIVSNDHFYIRTRYPDQIDENAPWTVNISGLVDAPVSVGMEALSALAVPQGVHLLECSGNSDGGAYGLMSAAAWGGVPVNKVLEMAVAKPGATRVLISGFDGHSKPSNGGHSIPGASWIFTFDQLKDAFLATEMNGQILPKDHGFPARLFVPGWYGCSCIKWVNEIVLVDENEPATAQMKEFSSRTHQNGTPLLAKDYIPATMDQAAMPIAIDKWITDGKISYRMVGIMWGGYALTDKLAVEVNGGKLERVEICPTQKTNQTWTLWRHPFVPSGVGKHKIRMRIDDPDVPQRRLGWGWYEREVTIDEV